MARRLEILTNVCVVIAALVFCGVTVKDRWFASPAALVPPAATESRLLNTRLALPGLEWTADKTLVMALSTQCHFCQESMPFYKALGTSSAVSSKQVALMMIFPQPQDEAESYVKSKDIHADRIVSMSLQPLGVSATPTMFLVDRSGKIEKLWVGVLSLAQQKDLLGELSRRS